MSPQAEDARAANDAALPGPHSVGWLRLMEAIRADEAAEKWWCGLTHWLRTEEQYENAPVGTEVWPDSGPSSYWWWVKGKTGWYASDDDYPLGSDFFRRQVKKWGDR